MSAVRRWTWPMVTPGSIGRGAAAWGTTLPWVWMLILRAYAGAGHARASDRASPARGRAVDARAGRRGLRGGRAGLPGGRLQGAVGGARRRRGAARADTPPVRAQPVRTARGAGGCGGGGGVRGGA